MCAVRLVGVLCVCAYSTVFLYRDKKCLREMLEVGRSSLASSNFGVWSSVVVSVVVLHNLLLVPGQR